MWRAALLAISVAGCAIAFGDRSTANVNTNTDAEHQLRVVKPGRAASAQ